MARFCLTFGANSCAVGAILQVSRALFLTVLGHPGLIIALRLLAGLPRLRGLLFLLLLLLLRVGRHCFSPGIHRRLRLLRGVGKAEEASRDVFTHYVRYRLEGFADTCAIRGEENITRKGAKTGVWHRIAG